MADEGLKLIYGRPRRDGWRSMRSRRRYWPTGQSACRGGETNKWSALRALDGASDVNQLDRKGPKVGAGRQ